MLSVIKILVSVVTNGLHVKYLTSASLEFLLSLIYLPLIYSAFTIFKKYK